MSLFSVQDTVPFVPTGHVNVSYFIILSALTTN